MVQAATSTRSATVVDRGHVQYAGRLTSAERVHYVRQGHGQSGHNRDYVLDAVRALEMLGYRETDLHLLAQRLGAHDTAITRSGRLGHQAFGLF